MMPILHDITRLICRLDDIMYIYNVLNQIKASSIVFVNKISFSVELVSFQDYCF